MKYELHPLCAAWPEMNKKQLAELTDDIKANGLRSPHHSLRGKGS